MNANQRAQFRPKRVALAALTAGALAAAANTALFLLLNAVGIDFTIQPAPTAPAAPIALPNFVAASFLPALLAGGLLMLLGRLTTKARGASVVIASAFAVLSLAGPATVGGASAGTRVALMVMHLLSAAIISGALLGRAAFRSPAQPRPRNRIPISAPRGTPSPTP
jgi:hypothetical protein